jgi:hypothetical protein
MIWDVIYWHRVKAVQCYFVLDQYVSERKVSDILYLGQRVPWTLHPLDNACLTDGP